MTLPSIKKLRELHLQEISQRKKDALMRVVERTKTMEAPPTLPVVKKLEIDPVKLEQTIKKAVQSSSLVPKMRIVFLEEAPQQPKKPDAVTAAPSSVCIARNLNGTPCKCKAKLGKFCAKHAR